MANGKLEQIKRDFYAKIRKKYNTTDEQIINVLKNAGYKSFESENINGYTIILDAFFKKEKEIKEFVKHSGDWRKRFYGVKEPIPCPIIGCLGIKKPLRRNINNWVCSLGGREHYTAYRVAKIWKKWHPNNEISIEEFATERIKNLEARLDEKEKTEKVEYA